MNILFLDFNGPLLNYRCGFNPRVPMLDNNAVDVVNHLLDRGYVLVISAAARLDMTSWSAVENHLSDWGIKATGRVHKDCITSTNIAARHVEVDAWFARNPKVDASHAIVLDTNTCPEAWQGPAGRCDWITCNVYDGMTWAVLRHSVLYDLMPEG